jgi:hypothetical protein
LLNYKLFINFNRLSEKIIFNSWYIFTFHERVNNLFKFFFIRCISNRIPILINNITFKFCFFSSCFIKTLINVFKVFCMINKSFNEIWSCIFFLLFRILVSSINIWYQFEIFTRVQRCFEQRWFNVSHSWSCIWFQNEIYILIECFFLNLGVIFKVFIVLMRKNFIVNPHYYILVNSCFNLSYVNMPFSIIA